MKILAVGRNYVAHAKELGNSVPTEPVIFMKPDTALLTDNASFYHPEFSSDIHFETEIVLKIDREGKHIQERFALDYFKEISLGIDFTARDLQSKLKEKGLPWELSKSFDNSAVVGQFISKPEELENISFSLLVNGVERQNGNTGNMLFGFARIIAYVSKFITLRKGDLIYTGTPEGVGKVSIGDRLEGFIGGQKIFDFEIK